MAHMQNISACSGSSLLDQFRVPNCLTNAKCSTVELSIRGLVLELGFIFSAVSSLILEFPRHFAIAENNDNINYLKKLNIFLFYNNNQSINKYKFYSESNITENIKIFLQLYMIKSDVLTCNQDLVGGGCYYILLT